MSRVHFGSRDGVDHDLRRLCRAMRSPRRRHQPVVMIGGHEHELAPAMASDLHRLALRLVLKRADLPLKFERRRFGYIPAPSSYSDNSE